MAKSNLTIHTNIYTDSLLLIQINLIFSATEFAPCMHHRQITILEEIATYCQFSLVVQTLYLWKHFVPHLVFLNGWHIRHNEE